MPIKNYAGNENVYIVTFNPSVSSPRDAASALCNQNKAEFGLIADEFVESNCIVPVTAYIVDNMNQSFNGNNSPTAQDSVVEREVTVAAVASSSSSSELA